MLTASLPVLLSSPTAVVASVLLFLVALEAHRMLRAALRQRRKGGKYALKLAGLQKKRLDTCPRKTEAPDLETPTVDAPAPRTIPELPFRNNSKKLMKVVELPGKSVSLLPVEAAVQNGHGLAPMARPVPQRVPVTRQCSSEERLADAIQGALFSIRKQEQQPKVVKPLDVIAKLRAANKGAKKVSFGCGTILGSNVTLIDHLPTVTPGVKAAGPLPLMPSRTTDSQTKSLIGSAVKVPRCAECTRPLPPGLSSALICNRCKVDREEEQPTVSGEYLETDWAPVKSRRRKRSEKSSSTNNNNNKSKSSSSRGRSSRRRTRSDKTSSSGTKSQGKARPQRRRSAKVPVRDRK